MNTKLIAKILTTIALLPSYAYAAGKLNSVFEREMIGANVSYLEQYTGPARNSYKNSGKIYNTYKVDGCEVQVEVSGKTVSSLALNTLNNKCTFDLAKFTTNMNSGKPVLAHNLTFGFIDSYFQGGKYTASCLWLCGNAADPVVNLDVEASRADGLFHITVGVVLASGPALDASSKWESVMTKKEGENWVIETKFNNTNKYDDVAAKYFKNVRIDSIKIGHY